MKKSLTLKPTLGTTKVVPIDPSYFDKFTAQTIIRTLDQQPETWPLDLFEGEAEIFLFDPLYNYLQALKKRRNGGTTAQEDIKVGNSLTTFVFTQAVDWACVAEFISLQQTKLQSQDLTFKAIKTQPFYQSLIAANPSESLVEFSSDVEGVLAFNEHLMNLLNPTSMELINSLARAAVDRATRAEVAEDAYQESLRAKFKLILDWTKKGKGPVAVPDARDKILAARMEVLQIIRDLLAPTAGFTPMVVTGATKEDFHEGMLAAILYLEYAKSIEDYDANWPEQSFQGLAQAWIMTMQAKATDLAGKWMTHHTDSLSYDIYRAQMILDMATTPYIEPLDRYFPDWKNDMKAYYETMSTFTSDIPEYIKYFAHEALSRQRAFVDDAELVADLDNSLTSLKDLIMETLPVERSGISIKWDSASNTWLLNGKKVSSTTTDYPFLSPEQVGEPEVYSPASKTSINRSATQKVLYILYQKEESLMSAIEVINSIKNIHSLLYGKDVLVIEKSALTSDIWRTLPLVGTLKQSQIAPFHMVDPISRVTIPWYCDWTDGELSIKWKGEPFLYRIVNPHPINQALMDSVSDTWAWDKVNLPVTDAITQPFTNVALPVAFTQTRRRTWQPYLMSTWLVITQSKNGIHDDQLQLQSAATAIEQLEGEYGQSVTNHLIGNMLVYKKDDDGDYQLITPTVPAVYGVPLDEFIQAQHIDDGTKKGKTGDEVYKLSSTTIQHLRSKDLAREVKLRDQAKGFIYYAFVLLSRFPKPQLTTTRLWEYRPKIYLPISIMQAYVDPSTPWILTSDSLEGKSPAATWTEPLGWSDLVGAGLHLFAKCEPLQGSWDFWNAYRLAEVYSHYDFSGRYITFRSYMQQSAYVYDEDDRVEALNQTDPDFHITETEVKPHEELVLKATLKAHFLNDVEKKPDSMAPRISDAQIRTDLKKTCFDAILQLQKDGQIALVGGQLNDEAVASAILKGSLYTGSKDGVPAISLEGPADLEETSPVTADNAVTAFEALRLKAKGKKKDKKDKDEESNPEENL